VIVPVDVVDVEMISFAPAIFAFDTAAPTLDLR
jgi:hypothetical protein